MTLYFDSNNCYYLLLYSFWAFILCICAKIKQIDIEIENTLVTLPQEKWSTKQNDESIMHNLHWTAGNCNLYNILEFRKKPWDEYLSLLNQYGGHYKHRWGDLETIGLFCWTHFNKNPHNFDLKNKGLYDNKFPSSLSSYAPGNNNLNEHNFFIIRLFNALKYFVKKIFF